MDRADLIARPDRWARLLGWTTLAGLAAGVSGPFGSYAANLVTRLAYWTGLFWTGTALLRVSLVLGTTYGKRLDFPPLFGAAVAVLIGSPPLSLLAAGGCHLFWPLRASGVRYLEWYGQTLFVALPGAALAYWLEMRPDRAGPMQAIPSVPRDCPPPAAPGQELQATVPLPEHLVETAICLQMEDHHVRVHRLGHSSLHLAAMRDVVRQIGEERGLQVHRSWWVARGAVRTAEADGRAVTLLLSNGLRVPVARSRVALLRQHGWLTQAPRPVFPA